MAAKETEAIILRTWPLQEADKIVSFFSRSEGRLRGVAPYARRSVKRFGASLEMLSHVRLRYAEKPHGGMARLEACDLLESFCGAQPSYEQIVGGSCISEVCELMLPEHEPNEPFFRLVALVSTEIGRTGDIWRPLTYFDLWAVRLAGFLPPFGECIRCHEEIATDQHCWFRPQWDGLLCRNCRGEDSWTLDPASRALARSMLTAPLAEIQQEGWTRSTGAELRRFLGQQMERHLERKLVTSRQLDEMG
ncbi:MAG: DNA repair protein RecO [Acidobacteria bacterium]|nr:DNA repair protein RecO [Acidobacteriota bacterium]